MQQSSRLFWIGTLPVLLLLIVLRWYLVGSTGFPDYDSVRNWEIIREISAGNFQNLFHHRSPLFFLFYSIFVPFFQDFHSYIYFNSLFQIAALLVLTHFFRQVFKLPNPEVWLLLLCMGCCVFLVYSARFFTIESPGLLVFALLVITYYKRFELHSRKAFYQTLGLVALGLSINYKFLLLVPIALVLEFLHRDGVLNLKTVAIGSFILLSPYILFAGFSVLVGLPFYKFPLTYSTMLNFSQENPAQRSGKFRLDLFYYLQYLWRFESPLVWLGLIGFPVLFWRKLVVFSAYHYCFGFTVLFLGGMSLLLKAPRGLLFIYPMLYLLGFLALRSFLSKKLLFFVLILLSCGYNVYVMNREIYSYANTNYPKVADFLQQNNITKVAGTAGLKLKPFLPENINYEVALDSLQLEVLKQKGYHYVLLDDYRKPTNIFGFNYLERQPSVFQTKERTLEAPLLYLEHSEFTGLSFNQTIDIHQKALRDTIKLRLIRIQ